MPKQVNALVLAAGLLLLGGCEFDGMEFGDSSRYKEDFSYNYKLAPGGHVFLENFNGSVEVFGWEKDTVDISGTKSASREEIVKQMKIEVIPQGDSIRIRTIRPVERNCNCGARYVIRLPRKTILDRIESSNGSIRLDSTEGQARLRTSNGSITVVNVNGDLEATTSNASVDVSSFQGAAVLKSSNGRIRATGVRGNFEGTTSNASIDVEIDRLDSGRPLRLESSNGSINLTLNKWNNNDVYAHTSNSSVNVNLPDGLNAELRAHTSNGSISSDFEVSSKEFSKTTLNGRVGSGGALLDLTSSNGNIRIRKAGSGK